jgi:FkbM family methyltransferase
MRLFRSAVQMFASKLGYNLSRKNADTLGENAFDDMKRFVPQNKPPLILDIGANVGQSSLRLNWTFPKASIHAFEPSPTTFQTLQTNFAKSDRVKPWNLAMGETPGALTFQENECPDMSSFLDLGAAGWGKIIKETKVPVTTVDQFLAEQQIPFVDVLKSDTQGFDLQVFKGAEQAMRANRIGMVYCEFTFVELYQGMPSFQSVFQHLIERNFLLVAIYDVHHKNRHAGWCDMLFVNKEYHAKSAPNTEHTWPQI